MIHELDRYTSAQIVRELGFAAATEQAMAATDFIEEIDTRAQLQQGIATERHAIEQIAWNAAIVLTPEPSQNRFVTEPVTIKEEIRGPHGHGPLEVVGVLEFGRSKQLVEEGWGEDSHAYEARVDGPARFHAVHAYGIPRSDMPLRSIETRLSGIPGTGGRQGIEIYSAELVRGTPDGRVTTRSLQRARWHLREMKGVVSATAHAIHAKDL